MTIELSIVNIIVIVIAIQLTGCYLFFLIDFPGKLTEYKKLQREIKRYRY